MDVVRGSLRGVHLGQVVVPQNAVHGAATPPKRGVRGQGDVETKTSFADARIDVELLLFLIVARRPQPEAVGDGNPGPGSGA